jgi:glycosyltransferase involved in cell wall biosynthesis
MRILHVITGLDDGGAEAVLARLCLADPTGGHGVVSLMGPGKYGASLIGAGIPVWSLGMPQGRLTLRGIRQLWRLLRRERPSIVQTWMYHADLVGGILARLATPAGVVWNIRNSTLSVEDTSSSTRLVVRLNAALSQRVPSRIVCCAVSAAEVHAGLGYAREKLVVIPNGFDPERFRPDPAAGQALRRTLGIAPDQPVLGMVARYHPQKDHRNLLQAVARLRRDGPRPTLVLAGRGLDRANAELAAMLEAEGLRDVVHLLGPRDDVPAVMNALDVHVLASRFGEAFPNVLAEAMACGTPCVATDVGDAARIVGDCGWVVDPGQPASLAQALAAALAARSDQDGWQRRRDRGRRYVVETFSPERMVDRYRALWRAVDAWQGGGPTDRGSAVDFAGSGTAPEKPPARVET